MTKTALNICKYCGKSIAFSKGGGKSFGTNGKESYHIHCMVKCMYDGKTEERFRRKKKERKPLD